MLSPFERGRYAFLACELSARYQRNPDYFGEAYKDFLDEVRACYDPKEDGGVDAYLAEAAEIFEIEWNDDGSDGDDELDKAVMDQTRRFDQAAEARKNFKVVT